MIKFIKRLFKRQMTKGPRKLEYKVKTSTDVVNALLELAVSSETIPSKLKEWQSPMIIVINGVETPITMIRLEGDQIKVY